MGQPQNKKFASKERRGLQERAGGLSNSPALLCNSPCTNLPQSPISEQGGDCFQHACAAHLSLNSCSLAQKGPQASLTVTSVWGLSCGPSSHHDISPHQFSTHSVPGSHVPGGNGDTNANIEPGTTRFGLPELWQKLPIFPRIPLCQIKILLPISTAEPPAWGSST